MVVIGIISLGAFAIWLAIWSDVMSREEAGRDLEVDYRELRFAQLSNAADALRDELGREPTVREIYGAIETGESAVDDVIDLRERTRRVTGDVAGQSVGQE